MVAQLLNDVHSHFFGDQKQMFCSHLVGESYLITIFLYLRYIPAMVGWNHQLLVGGTTVYHQHTDENKHCVSR